MTAADSSKMTAIKMASAKIHISQPTPDGTLNIALDTMRIGKQALIFVGTKPGAEKTAEEIAKKLNTSSPELDELSLYILHALTQPTKQCERLARCVKKGISFHHSGLTHKQRTAIEDAFRKGTIKIICCTPTLAAGLDLPAYRAVIRDLKRYGNEGMQWIPVLEYLQMSGRAGRPKYDTEGQAIAVAAAETDKKRIYERYVLGEPEDIYSKLAAEPALRTYILSLVATRFVTTRKEIFSFFSKTFWAHQYRDMKQLNATITRIIGQLESWGLIAAKDDFSGADELGGDSEGKVSATITGKRAAELYIDPLTAHHMITCARNASRHAEGVKDAFPFLLMASTSLEMRPLLRANSKDYETISEVLVENEGRLLQQEPSIYEEDYDEFMNSAKTAMFLHEWAEEKSEAQLLEKYNIRPGEVHAKLQTAEWLLYSARELSKLLSLKSVALELTKLSFRVKYGVKEELFALLKLKGIGRARARRLYSNKITDIGDVKKADMATLSQILGPKVAEDIKKQVGQGLKEDKGQLSLTENDE
ncbi:hypothetical protein HYV82_05870 [Candidatus Woesearchaeota archaeon]|nr:hypothetical protein [Candidatus Woesearchaeota archaeon]